MSESAAHKKLLIVYHSQSGRNERLARAAHRGAAEEAVELRLRRAMEASIDDLLWCDGIVLATPENLGALSGGMKDFFDRTFYPAQPHQLNLPYVVMIGCGNDGSGALRQLERIVRGYPLRRVADPLIVHGEPGASDLERAQELGLTMAAGLSLGIF